MKNSDWLKIWVKERDEACQSFDVEVFKEFYRKWAKRGFYEIRVLPPDEIIEITMRKMVVNLANPIPEKYEEARTWLLERGHDLGIV